MFENLGDRKFEELVYDLLVAMGFVNVSWRRGTGKAGASADQGRDIEADLLRRDIDGAEHFEKWFVQCKHYTAGVPPTSFSDAVAWAEAERPSVLVIAASNFLSNPAKQWVDKYAESRKPPFRIKIWEGKDLERHLSFSPLLGVKYGLTGEPLEFVHPAHLQYVLSHDLTTLGYFLETIATLDAGARDEIFSFAYHAVVNPRYRPPVSGDETLGELMVDPVDYDAFRASCLKLTRAGVAEHLLVQAIMVHTLGWAQRFADPTHSAGALERNRGAIEYCEAELETESDPKRRETLERMIDSQKRLIDSAPERLRTWAEHYRLLCETVLPRLTLEAGVRFGAGGGQN